jgi:hypothetical protein
MQVVNIKELLKPKAITSMRVIYARFVIMFMVVLGKKKNYPIWYGHTFIVYQKLKQVNFGYNYMTKKDFELIASWIYKEYHNRQDSGESNLLEKLANDIANNLETKYPRFNKEKFLQACGVKVECDLCGWTPDAAGDYKGCIRCGKK